MYIRKATLNDKNILTKIAFAAKGYWGYSDDFLGKLKDDLTVTDEDIYKKAIFLIEESGEIKAFYSLNVEAQKLESLFVHPTYIGKGYGKILWNDILCKAKEYQLDKFQFEAEPNAYEFYRKLGAKKVCDIQSSIVLGRTYPLMEYIF